MKFITRLNQQDPPEVHGIRTYEPLQVGNFILSIQGSQVHYCEPRRTLRPEDYESMEFAIFRNRKHYTLEELAILKDDGLLPVDAAIHDKGLILLLERYHSDGVYGYVPVTLIEQLYVTLGGN